MAERLRIGIAGGSLGGLGAAALLTRAGHDVTVFERSASGLSGRGAGLVAQDELLALLDAAGRPDAARGTVTSERIVLDRAGRIVSRDPTPQTQLSWDVLHDALRSTLADATYLTGMRVAGAGCSDGAAYLDLGTRGRREFDVVVGADGLHSAVRGFVAPEQKTNAYSGYVTWRGLLPETALPPEAADVLTGRFAFFTGRGGARSRLSRARAARRDRAGPAALQLGLVPHPDRRCVERRPGRSGKAPRRGLARTGRAPGRSAGEPGG